MERLKQVWSGVKNAVSQGLQAIIALFRQNSLRRTLVLAVLLVSLVPVLLVGGISYWRTRSQIFSLVTNQIASLTDYTTNQLGNFVFSKQSALYTHSVKDTFTVNTLAALKEEMPLPERTAAIVNLRTQFSQLASGGGIEPAFTVVFLMEEDGTVVAASDQAYINRVFGNAPVNHPVILGQFGKQAVSAVINPFQPSSLQNELFLIVSQPVKIAGLDKPLTLYGISNTVLFNQVLNLAASFYPDSRAVLIFPDGVTYESSSTVSGLRNLPTNTSLLSVIEKESNAQEQLFTKIEETITWENENGIASIRRIPNTSLHFAIVTPLRVLYGNVGVLDRFTRNTLFIVLIILGVLTYTGARWIVNPLLHLSEVAKSLASGNFNVRSRVRRSDEIGLLASSMNQMADQLASLYTSLEQAVEARTRQLRTASEVAQLVISSTSLGEILDRTVELVNERFNLYHTAIYLKDQSGTMLVLSETSGFASEERKQQAVHIPIAADTTPSEVARNNRAISVDRPEEAKFLADPLLPDSQSQAFVPIAFSNEVLGVLELHQSTPKGFDEDTLFVMQTLANQIAAALRNVRTLEAAQFNLEETNLINQATRQISEAQTEDDVVQSIIGIMPQLPYYAAILSLERAYFHIQALYDPHTLRLERGLSSIDIPATRALDSLTRGAPIFVEDIHQPSEYENLLSFFLRRGCKSAMLLPMLKGNKVAYVFILAFTPEEEISQAILQPFINLVEVVNATLDKLNVLETLRARLNELQVLANFSRVTIAETNLQKLYRALYEQISDNFGSDLGFIIATYDEKQGRIEFPFAIENDEILEIEPMPLGEGLTSYIIQNQKPLLINNEAERRAIELSTRIVGKPARSWLGVPLIAGGKLLGAMILQDQEHEERFSEYDLNLFMTLAPQVATAIRNAQLVQEMQNALHAYDYERLLLQTWLTHTPDAIAIKDRQARYQRVSQYYADMQGMSPEDMMGKTDYDVFVNKEDAEQTIETDMRVMEMGRPFIEDIRGTANDYYRVSRLPVVDQNGQVVGLITISRDVSDIFRAQQEMQKRAQQVQTTAEIARDITGTLNIDELLAKVVNLVRERFGFYHASIFLLDSEKQYAVLRESTGEAGRIMKERGHRLAVGSRSIVGQATYRGEAIIVEDVTEDPTHLPNPLLPDTRAELAIPLKFADEVIGALDVQSTQPNVFTDEDIEILGILADQLAAAIHNAELYEKAQDLISRHRLLNRLNLIGTSAQTLNEALLEIVNQLLDLQIADAVNIRLLNSSGQLELAVMNGYGLKKPALLMGADEGLQGACLAERRGLRVGDVSEDPRCIELGEDTHSVMVIPLLFGEEALGVITFEARTAYAFNENDLEVMTSLANNLSGVIMSWRLVQQVSQQVERQKLLFEATSRIRRSMDIGEILKTSVVETVRVLGARRAQIRLSLSEGSGSPSEKGDGHNGSQPVE